MNYLSFVRNKNFTCSRWHACCSREKPALPLSLSPSFSLPSFLRLLLSHFFSSALTWFKAQFCFELPAEQSNVWKFLGEFFWESKFLLLLLYFDKTKFFGQQSDSGNEFFLWHFFCENVKKSFMSCHICQELVQRVIRKLSAPKLKWISAPPKKCELNQQKG